MFINKNKLPHYKTTVINQWKGQVIINVNVTYIFMSSTHRQDEYV